MIRKKERMSMKRLAVMLFAACALLFACSPRGASSSESANSSAPASSGSAGSESSEAAAKPPETAEIPLGTLCDLPPFTNPEIKAPPLAKVPFPDIRLTPGGPVRYRLSSIATMFLEARGQNEGVAFIPEKASSERAFYDGDMPLLAFNLTIAGAYSEFGAAPVERSLTIPFLLEPQGPGGRDYQVIAPDHGLAIPGTDEKYSAEALNEIFCSWLESEFEKQELRVGNLNAYYLFDKDGKERTPEETKRLAIQTTIEQVYASRLVDRCVGVHDGEICFFPAEAVVYVSESFAFFEFPKEIVPVKQVESKRHAFAYPWAAAARATVPGLPEDARFLLIRLPDAGLEPDLLADNPEQAAMKHYPTEKAKEIVSRLIPPEDATVLCAWTINGPRKGAKIAQYLFLPLKRDYAPTLAQPETRPLNGKNEALSYQPIRALNAPAIIISDCVDDAEKRPAAPMLGSALSSEFPAVDLSLPFDPSGKNENAMHAGPLGSLGYLAYFRDLKLPGGSDAK